MPFERNEPTRWWHGAEAAPRMPAEPGPWALVPTPCGWEWRRQEAHDASPAAVQDVRAEWDDLRGALDVLAGLDGEPPG